MQRADLRDAPRTVSQRKAAAGSTATGVDNETTALRGRQLGYATMPLLIEHMGHFVKADLCIS